ncbi:PaaI family thioesterase [Paracoccus sediminicola]|uniref:PaaI family thioesterase n=1 Tax=Paracoccus sediminicola TaxID=3017783 RepID=UPI0022F009F1|nr:PaaI family thioesterase [Paracoccus sediminicola]WBU56786.1 PaaI family thioesterase [Paracoccus sediminicola]
MTDAERIAQIAERQPEFTKLLGMEMVEAELDRVVMALPVTKALSNRNGVMHGGAILGLTDNVGGTAASLNLKKGENTVTLESKVNFLRPIRIGDTARATATPVHIGGTTQIWEVVVTRGDGKVAARVTQTQMTIQWKEPAG